MAVDSKFFNIPFATSGDKTVIPEAVQPSGVISYTQGYGPDYERDPATDPLAKRVPRDETNELYFEITNALRFIQLYGTPQWTAVADGGPTNYPISARVRYDAGAGMQAWRSIAATNTATPGSDITKWILDEAFSFTTLEATLAEALAGTLATKVITPRRMASAVQQGAWNYAVAGGTANALTLTLAPAPAAYTAGLEIQVKLGVNPNTTAMTLNVNGLGAVAIINRDGSAMGAGDAPANAILDLVYDGGSFRLLNVTQSTIAAAAAVIEQAQVIGTRNVLYPFNTLLTIAWGTSFTKFLDPATTFTSGTLTIGPKDAGLWMASFWLNASGRNDTTLLWGYVIRNGLQYAVGGDRDQNGAVGGMNSTISIPVRLVSGDTLQTQVLQQNLASQSQTILSNLGLVRISA